MDFFGKIVYGLFYMGLGALFWKLMNWLSKHIIAFFKNDI